MDAGEGFSYQPLETGRTCQKSHLQPADRYLTLLPYFLFFCALLFTGGNRPDSHPFPISRGSPHFSGFLSMHPVTMLANGPAFFRGVPCNNAEYSRFAHFPCATTRGVEVVAPPLSVYMCAYTNLPEFYAVAGYKSFDTLGTGAFVNKPDSSSDALRITTSSAFNQRLLFGIVSRQPTPNNVGSLEESYTSAAVYQHPAGLRHRGSDAQPRFNFVSDFPDNALATVCRRLDNYMKMGI